MFVIITLSAVGVREAVNRLPQPLLELPLARVNFLVLARRRKRGENRMGHRMGADLNEASFCELPQLIGRQRAMCRPRGTAAVRADLQIVQGLQSLRLSGRSKRGVE